MAIDFREFYDECTFVLLHEGCSNWDYYSMHYKDKEPCVVALAKPGSGASDCFFGSMPYFQHRLDAGQL